MKDNVKVFHVKRRGGGLRRLIFAQIAFEKCAEYLSLENTKVDIKVTIASSSSLLASNVCVS